MHSEKGKVVAGIKIKGTGKANGTGKPAAGKKTVTIKESLDSIKAWWDFGVVINEHIIGWQKDLSQGNSEVATQAKKNHMAVTKAQNALKVAIGELHASLFTRIAEESKPAFESLNAAIKGDNNTGNADNRINDDLRRQIQEAGNRIDERNTQKLVLSKNPDDVTREQEYRNIRQQNIYDQNLAIAAGKELRQREELDRLEAENQKLVAHQEQTNKLIAGDEQKSGIEKAKANCECIEKAFDKYFGDGKLVVQCVPSDSGNDDMHGGAGSDTLRGGAGNDNIYGMGQQVPQTVPESGGYDMASQYALYGMGQEAMRTGLLPDEGKANDLAASLQETFKGVADTIGSAFGNVFEDVVLKGESFGDSMRGLLDSVAGSLMQDFTQKISSFLTDTVSTFAMEAMNFLFTSLFAGGGVMSAAGPLPLRAYANGGIANSPQLAVFGEGSMNEAYVPLPDGRRIPVNMNMDGMSSNGGGDVYQITQNVTVQGSSGQGQDESDKMAAQMMQSLDRAMTEKIDNRIQQSRRVGGIANPLRRMA